MSQRDGSIERPLTVKQAQELIDSLEGEYEGPPLHFGRWGRNEAVLVSMDWYREREVLLDQISNSKPESTTKGFHHYEHS